MACDVCDKRLAYALKHLWWWAEAEVNSEVGADRVFSTFDELPPPARISAGGAKSQVALGVASPAEKLAAEVIKQIAPKVKDVAEGMWSPYIERDLTPACTGSSF